MSSNEKIMILKGLSLGDIVKCIDDKEYSFMKVNRTKFVAKRDGTTYSIPIEYFASLERKSEKEFFDADSLQEGDLFYILERNQNVTVYRYKYKINADKIMAENPVTKTGVKVHINLVSGNVQELLLQNGSTIS